LKLRDFYPIFFKKDLKRLTKAMLATGFSREDIAAFMGGNTYRVLASSI
jgi:microsomal dipeptidase-like Zn-dependent dipeptidase